MKNFISNFLKGVGVMTITAGIIYAADLTLTSGQPITLQKWSDLVAEVTGSTTKNNTQDTQISDLVDEINNLKTRLSSVETANTTQQNQIDNFIASGGNIVKKVSSYKTSLATNRQNWTISGLTIGKPLIIGVDSGSGQNITYMRVTSGVDFGRTASDSYTYIFADEKSSWGTPPSYTLVPTATTVTIRVLAYNSNRNKGTLYAYQ